MRFHFQLRSHFCLTYNCNLTMKAWLKPRVTTALLMLKLWFIIIFMLISKYSQSFKHDYIDLKRIYADENRK